MCGIYVIIISWGAMKRSVWLSLLLFGLCSCATAGSGGKSLDQMSIDAVKGMGASSLSLYNRGGGDAVIEASKASVRDQYKDPFSVQFRDIRIVKIETGYIVCGEANAKNGYGAYVGFKPFAASPSGAIIWHDSRYRNIERDANAGIILVCGHR